MLQKLIHFVKYHNALPVALSLVIVSSGAALAASPEVREQVVSAESIARSVDNSYILTIDLKAFNPTLQITAVTEDDNFYYVSYTYKIVAINNYVWKDTVITEELNVSKGALGTEDLGRYVAKQLGEEVDAKLSYLTSVQNIEKNRGVTKKVITTTYSGLVGKFLDPKEEVFEGYAAVVPEQQPTVAAVEEGKVSAQIAVSNELSAQVAAALPSKAEIQKIIEQTVKELLAENNEVTPETEQATTAAPAATADTDDTEPPVISIIGNNPAEIAVGANYVDLGATVTDNKNDNIGIHYAVDGIDAVNINIDTSSDGTHVIIYSATDQAGNTGTASRTVIVGTGIAPAVESADTTLPESASTTPATPTEETATTTSETPQQTQQEDVTTTTSESTATSTSAQ